MIFDTREDALAFLGYTVNPGDICPSPASRLAAALFPSDFGLRTSDRVVTAEDTEKGEAQQ